MVLPIPRPEGPLRDAVVGVKAGTDNKGNTYLVDKLLTTSYPLCTVLMEVSAQAQAKGVSMQLGWLPRDANQPADDLTNEVFDKFSEQHQAQVWWEDRPFSAIPDIFRDGLSFMRLLDIHDYMV